MENYGDLDGDLKHSRIDSFIGMPKPEITNTVLGISKAQPINWLVNSRFYVIAVTRGFTSDRDAPPSFGDVHDNERYAIVEIGNRNGQNIQRESFSERYAIVEIGNRNGQNIQRESFSSSARSNEYRLSTPKQLALQKVKREEIEAKAVAWEEAKMTKVDNRFMKDEAIIDAWENEQAVKANIKMKKVERKLEEKRATAFEKMQNEIAKNHRKAENRRAVAAARRGAARAKLAEASDKIRSAGRFPRKCLLC